MSQYRTGTVSLTNGDATVTGTGTEFLANVAAGDLFARSLEGVPYYVGSVTDDTHLELSANYAGTTGSGLSYAITTSRTTNLDLPYPESSSGQAGGDVDTATTIKAALVTLDTKLAVAASANLGTMALQNANAVAITGGTISGLSSLSVAGSASVGDAIGEYIRVNGGSTNYTYLYGNINATSSLPNSNFGGTIIGWNASGGSGETNIITSVGGGGASAIKFQSWNGTTLTEWAQINATALAPVGLLDLSGAAAGQIKFPATQNASANANTLDDYEEGTFTPSLSGVGGSAISYTAGTDNGRYTKVGNVVTTSMLIDGTWTGGPPGSWRISLPFTAGTDPHPPAPIYNSNTGAFVGTGGGRVEGGLSSVRTFATLTSGESLTAGGSFFV